MATKYARATGNWTTDATWSTTSGGAADTTKPTAADDVVLDAASGAITVTIDSGAVCRSLDCDGYTGTLTHTSGVTLLMGDSGAPAGGRLLRLSAGMTYSPPLAGYIYTISTHASTQTITTAGKNLGRLQVQTGTGTTTQLADAFTAQGDIELNQGTLDTNGQAVSVRAMLVTGSSTRTLTLGSSAITLSSTGTAWSAATVTNLTVTANTATVTCTGAAATFSGGSKNWNGLSLVMTGSGTTALTAPGILGGFTRTGTAAKTDGLTLSTGLLVTGTLTLTGNSTTNRLLVASLTLGTAVVCRAGAVSLSNADFRDVTAVGDGANPVNVDVWTSVFSGNPHPDALWADASHPTATGYGLINDQIVTAMGDPGAGTVVVLGDSWGINGAADLNTKLDAAYTDVTVVNASVSGERLLAMVARFDTDVAPYAPSHVIHYSGFANDISSYAPAELAAHAGAFFAKCWAIGAIPVMLGGAPLSVNIGTATSIHTDVALAMTTVTVAWTGTSLANAGGSSGDITFATPVTRYAVATGSASSTAVWSATSGGASGASVPTCQDNVVLNAASGAITVTNDMPRMCADLTCTGYTGTLTLSASPSDFYGSITLGSGMTIGGVVSSTLFGRSSHTITSAGKTWPANMQLSGYGGTYTLTDALTLNRSVDLVLLVRDNCTFNDGGFSVSLTGAASAFGALTPATVNASGTWTIASTTNVTPWQWYSGTLNHTGTIVLSGATATDRTFAGGSKTYGTLTDQNTLGGKLTISGTSPTFGTINKTATVACTLALPTSSGITVTGQFNVQGTSTATLTLTGDVTKASGLVECDFMSISSSDATGGAKFYAPNSTDGGSNTGWIFTAAPTPTSAGNKSLVYQLNRLAGTSGLEMAGAANAWAGTSGLEVVGALNARIRQINSSHSGGLELNGACRELARLLGGDPSYDAPAALASIPT